MNVRERIAALGPESDQEATFMVGLGLLAAGFGLAEVLDSIIYLPLSLIVPGGVLTLVGMLAKPTEDIE